MIEEFKLLPTPNPREVSFVVQVLAKDILSKGVPEVGAAYKTCSQVRGVNMADGFKDYVFAQVVDGEPNYVGFLFVKSRTVEEAKVAFRTHEETISYNWPNVLKSLKFFRDTSFPVWTEGPGGRRIYGARHFVRKVYIPGGSYATTVVTEEFLGNDKFDIPPARSPQPGDVSFDYLDVEGAFRALHDDLTLPNLRTAVAAYTTGGESGEVSGVLPGQFFPATNFTDWAPHTIEDAQVYSNGLWYRTRRRVRPPIRPRTITE